MEIIFKGDIKFYVIENNKLFGYFINDNTHIDLSNIKHLSNIKALYYYRYKESNIKLPVYCEHNGTFLSYSNALSEYVFLIVKDGFTKDYTLANLNLI